MGGAIRNRNVHTTNPKERATAAFTNEREALLDGTSRALEGTKIAGADGNAASSVMGTAT